MNNNGKNNHFAALRRAFDAHWPGPVGDAVSLEKGSLAVTVYPQDGARMTSLRVFGYELLRQWHAEHRAFQYGSFPLVPWVGRLRNGRLEWENGTYQLPVNNPPHALHGMACYSHWENVASTTDSLTLRMPLTEPWPWQSEVRQVITLQDDALTLRLEIHSASDTFPAAAGWHPWFAKWAGAPQEVAGSAKAEALQLTFAPDWQEEPGRDELPTGKRIAPRPGPWDDCFGFEHGMSVGLAWPGKVALHMTSTAPGLVVFDQQPDAACVNPLTQAPNAINTAPDYVTPTKPLIIETRWRFTRL